MLGGEGRHRFVDVGMAQEHGIFPRRKYILSYLTMDQEHGPYPSESWRGMVWIMGMHRGYCLWFQGMDWGLGPDISSNRMCIIYVMCMYMYI